ncbi:MAG TPA: hypothetical protein VFH99_02675 [Candidatus Saccharimonadales bacterium]|nr:hypothetical protein [Candidatus Saccharimonadales bacterium]
MTWAGARGRLRSELPRGWWKVGLGLATTPPCESRSDEAAASPCVGLHANRLAGIPQSILCIARPKRHAPQAKTRLKAFAKDYARRQGELEKAAERLREERDEAVRAAYKDGLPMKAIAQVMGMSHQRVSQIVRS